MGEDAVGVVDEEQKEIELLGGEVDVGAADADRAGGGVDGEVADGELRRAEGSSRAILRRLARTRARSSGMLKGLVT